jgi:hypothetical protein
MFTHNLTFTRVWGCPLAFVDIAQPSITYEGVMSPGNPDLTSQVLDLSKYILRKN